MMPKKQAFYAVFKGRKPGVYQTWTQCVAQTRGFPGSRFKKFTGPDAEPLAAHFAETGQEPDDKERNEVIKARARVQSTESIGSLDAGFFAPAENTGYTGKIDRRLEPFVVFTDGSVRRDEKTVQAGIGVWFGPSDRYNFGESFRLPNPTNNRCEVQAAIRAIERINERDDIPQTQEVVIGSDSQYVIRAMTQWWNTWQQNNFKNNTVKNRGMLTRLHNLCQERPVSFYYTPGHVGIPGNEGADRLAATGGATTDPGFQPVVAE